jgi:hypothetical protein
VSYMGMRIRTMKGQIVRVVQAILWKFYMVLETLGMRIYENFLKHDVCGNSVTSRLQDNLVWGSQKRIICRKVRMNK